MTYRPIKDNVAYEFHPSRSFDFSQIHPERRTDSKTKICIPAMASNFITRKDIIPESNTNVGREFMFRKSNVMQLLDRIGEENHVKIDEPAMNSIIDIVIKKITALLEESAQASRIRTNYYMRPMNERDLTSNPKLSQHFIRLELFYSAYIRRSQFPADASYTPYFYTTFNTQKRDIFHQEQSYEFYEQRQQNFHIFSSMKVKGLMVKGIAFNREDQLFLDRLDEYLKNQSSKPTTKSNKATEVLGQKDEEDSKLAERKIIPKDIFFVLSRWPKAFRNQVSNLQSEFFQLRTRDLESEMEPLSDDE